MLPAPHPAAAEPGRRLTLEAQDCLTALLRSHETLLDGKTMFWVCRNICICPIAGQTLTFYLGRRSYLSCFRLYSTHLKRDSVGPTSVDLWLALTATAFTERWVGPWN